jgi:hypothetical protein
VVDHEKEERKKVIEKIISLRKRVEQCNIEYSPNNSLISELQAQIAERMKSLGCRSFAEVLAIVNNNFDLPATSVTPQSNRFVPPSTAIIPSAHANHVTPVATNASIPIPNSSVSSTIQQYLLQQQQAQVQAQQQLQMQMQQAQLLSLQQQLIGQPFSLQPSSSQPLLSVQQIQQQQQLLSNLAQQQQQHLQHSHNELLLLELRKGQQNSTISQANAVNYNSVFLGYDSHGNPIFK